MNKRGFTLIELMVYMAILGIVVVVAGQAFSNSTKMRVRTEGMLKANQNAEDIAQLFRDDVAQMGAKRAYDASHSTASSDYFTLTKDVMLMPDGDSPDYSSFILVRKNGGDSLYTRRIQYNSDGTFLRLEEVSWFVDSQSLFRSCKTLGGVAADECPGDKPLLTEISDGVEQFKIVSGKPRVGVANSVMFPKYEDDASKKSFRLISYYGVNDFMRVHLYPESGSESVTMRGLISNFGNTGSDDGASAGATLQKHMVLLGESGSTIDAWNQCKEFEFKKDEVYEVAFEMPTSGDEARMFRPGRDHFAVGIRAVETEPTAVEDVPDYLFYPPAADNGTGTRSMRFSPHKEDVSACIAWTLVLFSPTVSLGDFTISNVTVKKVVENDYDFSDDDWVPATPEQKQEVRAFRLKLNLTRNKEHSAIELVVPVPSNGVGG